MIKNIYLTIFLLASMTMMPQLDIDFNHEGIGILHYPSALAEGDAKRLNINLRKLKEAAKSMKQFDELEKKGLPKRQVNLMRHAMESKISTMMTDVLAEIRKFK